MNTKTKWSGVSWMAGALVPLLVGVAGAATTTPAQSRANQPNQQNEKAVTAPQQATAFQLELDKARNLIGAKVVGDQGEKLGRVADIVLTPSRDAINYVAVAHGWTWGTAEKYVAVPWSRFEFKLREAGSPQILVLKGISRADFDRAPGFKQYHWPATASTNWLNTERSPGMTPAGNKAEAEAAPSMDIQNLRLSRLLGITIRNPQGENLGRLNDAMIDVRLGKLAYGIVAVRHEPWNLNKDYAAVPWSALRLTGQPVVARLDVTRDTLIALAFVRDHFPNLENPQYSRQLYERFHTTPYWGALGFVPGEERSNGGSSSSPQMMSPKATMRQHMMAEKTVYPLPYNPKAAETIKGTVSKVRTHRIKGTSLEVLRLTIQTAAGKTMRVDVGPSLFVDRQNFHFKNGEAVTITGAPAKMGRHEMLVASQIQARNQTLRLRSDAGKPLWNVEEFKAVPAPKGSHPRSDRSSERSDRTQRPSEW
jgi:sporulation protein YlmC with PRC-barrel domain